MMSETARFEREAADTRARIASTIDDLQERLSPKAIVDNAVDQLNASGRQAIASVRGAVMGHPIAIAATGAAVGLGLVARRKVRTATIEYGDSYAAYADYDDNYAADLAADDVPQGPVGARIDAMQHQAQVAVASHPISVVVAGVAAGVVLGAVVPITATERNLAGDVGSRLDAAVAAALEAAKGELDLSKLSFIGGTTGIADRAVGSLLTVLAAAGSALLRKPPAA